MKQTIVLLIVVLTALVVLAQESSYGPEMREEGMVMGQTERMMSEEWKTGVGFESLGSAELFLGNSSYLNLTEAQVSQLQVMHDSFIEKTKDTRTRLSTLEGELTGLVSAENPNIESINTKLKDVEETRTALIGAQIEHGINSRKVLNQNQIGLADNLFEIGRESLTDQPGASGPGM